MSTPPPPPPPPPPPMSPPPGYVVAGSPGTFKRVGGLGRALAILPIVSAVITLVLLLVQFSLRDRAADLLNGSTDALDGKLGAYVLVSLISGGVGIAILVLQCIWMFRMAGNLRVLRREPQTWKPGWGIAVWILAGCTLGILPYLMLREVWQGSDPTVAPGDPTWKRSSIGSIVHAWFIVTIAGVAISLIMGGAYGFSVGFRRGTNRDLAKLIEDRLPLLFVSSLLTIVSSLVFVALVKALTARHMAATKEA